MTWTPLGDGPVGMEYRIIGGTCFYRIHPSYHWMYKKLELPEELFTPKGGPNK